jgi:hypothetical protein
MRKAIALGVIGLAASLAFAATEKLQPLNVKTGLWQTTMTAKYTGLPPQMAAAVNPTMTYKGCIKPKDLSTNEWVTGFKCSSWTVLKSTGTDMEAEGKACAVGNGMTADGHGKFHALDSEHLTGTIDADFTGFTGNGSTVHLHADYTSNWLGATCPADVN